MKDLQNPTYDHVNIFFSVLKNTIEKQKRDAKTLKEKIYWEKERTKTIKAMTYLNSLYYQMNDWDTKQSIDLWEIPNA
jgi:SHS2 domain-containing protein